MTRVNGPEASIRSMVVNTVATSVFAAGSKVRSIENFASAEVKGSPLCHLTPWRSSNRQVVGSVLSHWIASPGESFPSGWRLVRLSKMLKETRMSLDEVEKWEIGRAHV